MLWYICFILAVLMLAVLVGMAIDKKMGRMRILYLALGLLATAYVAYLPAFFSQYSFMAALLAGVVNVLQVITVDADYLAFYDLIRSELGTGLFCNLYFVLLAGVHFLLPSVSAMTAITLVMRCVTQLQVGMIRRNGKVLHIFSEVNYQSTLFAADIRRQDKKCDILFLEENNDLDHSDLQVSLRCSVLYEQIENLRPGTKRRKAYYYCISENQEKNLDSSLAIIASLEDAPRAVQQNNYIFLFTRDPSAEAMIDSLDKGHVEIDIINEQQEAAYRLLMEHPLTEAADESGTISLLICGFTELGQELLRAAVWCGQISGHRLSVSVVGHQLETESANFRAAYPGLFCDRYDIRFYSYKNELEFHSLVADRCADAGYIVVCGRAETETIRQAVDLRRLYYTMDPDFHRAPAIYAYIRNADKAAALSRLRTAEAKPERRVSYGIVPFGMAKNIYTFQNITDSDLDKLSKNVHLVYEDIFSDGEINAVEAMGRYNLFEVNKRSNKANALHIRYKLLAMGLDYTADPDAEEVDFASALTDDLLQKLTVSEHDRWMAFLESEGWITASVEQSQTYQAAGLSRGRHNCPLLKLHPYICPFDDLKSRSDRLGLPDSTVYDREMITRIPHILHDKWGIAGKRYKIIKK